MADAAVADGMPRPQAYKFMGTGCDGKREDGIRDRKASGRIKISGMLPCRYDYRGSQSTGENRDLRSSVIEAYESAKDIAKRM